MKAIELMVTDDYEIPDIFKQNDPFLNTEILKLGSATYHNHYETMETSEQETNNHTDIMDSIIDLVALVPDCIELSQNRKECILHLTGVRLRIKIVDGETEDIITQCKTECDFQTDDIDAALFLSSKEIHIQGIKKKAHVMLDTFPICILGPSQSIDLDCITLTIEIVKAFVLHKQSIYNKLSVYNQHTDDARTIACLNELTMIHFKKITNALKNITTDCDDLQTLFIRLQKQIHGTNTTQQKSMPPSNHQDTNNSSVISRHLPDSIWDPIKELVGQNEVTNEFLRQKVTIEWLHKQGLNDSSIRKCGGIKTLRDYILKQLQ